MLLHPVGGLLILFTLLFVMFQAVFSWAAPVMDGIEAGIAWLGGLVANVLPDGLLQSLIVDGIISGVGSVLVFLPQILILFLVIIGGIYGGLFTATEAAAISVVLLVFTLGIGIVILLPLWLVLIMTSTLFPVSLA